MSEQEYKEIIKDLLQYIEVPDEAVCRTAVFVSTEQGLRNAADRIVALKTAVLRARESIGYISRAYPGVTLSGYISNE